MSAPSRVGWVIREQRRRLHVELADWLPFDSGRRRAGLSCLWQVHDRHFLLRRLLLQAQVTDSLHSNPSRDIPQVRPLETASNVPLPTASGVILGPNLYIVFSREITSTAGNVIWAGL